MANLTGEVRPANVWSLYSYRPQTSLAKSPCVDFYKATQVFLMNVTDPHSQSRPVESLSTRGVAQQLSTEQLTPANDASDKENHSQDRNYELLTAIERRNIAQTIKIVKDIYSQPDGQLDPYAMSKLSVFYLAQNRQDLIGKLVKKIPEGSHGLYGEVFGHYARSFAMQGKFTEARKIFLHTIDKKHKQQTMREKLKLEWIKMELSLLDLEPAKVALKKDELSKHQKVMLETRFRILQTYVDPTCPPIDLDLEIKKAVDDGQNLHLHIQQLDDYIGLVLAQGEYQKGLKAYEQILVEFVPKVTDGDVFHKKILLGMAKCHLLLGHFDETKRLIHEAMLNKACRTKHEFSHFKAQYYELSGKPKEALQEMLQLFFHPLTRYVDPQSKQPCIAFLRMCYRHGCYQEALNIQKEVLSAFPDLAFHFIKVHVAQGRSSFDLIDRCRFKNHRIGPFFCEEARLYLNPYSSCFDLSKAEDLLRQATEYTHQYGDSWLELARVEMIKKGVDADLSELIRLVPGAAPVHGELWYYLSGSFYHSPLLSFLKAIDRLREEMRPLMPIYQQALQGRCPTVFGPNDFFAASPSYCQAARSSRGIAGSLERHQLAEMIPVFCINKKVSG